MTGTRGKATTSAEMVRPVGRGRGKGSGQRRWMKGSQRPIGAVGSSTATEHGMASAGGLSEVNGERVVRAELPAAAPQRVLAQDAGRLRLAQLDECAREAGRRTQGDQVVRAELPAAAPQRVLAQDAGRLHLVQPDQGEGEAGRRR